MRKEDNREKYKEYDHRYYIKYRRPNSKICKLETKISDLEAKLAGKDQAIESLEELNRSLGQTCNNDRKEIERLRELISEKEKENDKLIAKLEQADEIINNPYTLIFQQQQLIDNLQSQIEEKEKELKKFKSIGATPRQLRRAYQERFKYNERYCELKKQHIQNKINFAVSYLEVIKAFIIDKEFYFTGEDYSTVYKEKIND